MAREIRDYIGHSLFYGVAISILPSHLVNNAIAIILNNINRSHPNLMRRLSALNGKTLLFIPTDTAYNFLAHMQNDRFCLQYISRNKITETSVRVTGRIIDLFKIVQGQCDADALFFSREIEIEGDVEAIVILRNAIESENINIFTETNNIVDILNKLVPGLSKTVGGALRDRFDIANISIRSILSDLESATSSHSKQLKKFEDRLSVLEASQLRLSQRHDRKN
jgi:predicted lipid carrier protein YhbT